MFATHFPPQKLALPGHHYHLHGREVAWGREHLGDTVDVEVRIARGRRDHRVTRRYVVRGLLVADVCGTPGRIDFESGTYRDLITSRGGDDGLQRVRVLAVHHHRRRR